jgi:2'-5' RNA ligase
MRLFLAIDIEDNVIRAIQYAVSKLRETRAPVRWVKPPGIHLTLKFLGETPPDRLDDMIIPLENVAAETMSFPLLVTGVGTFPEKRSPKVIWAGVEEPSGALARLHGSLERVMSGLGWAKEKRSFSPHITLGRVKGNINLGRLSDVVRSLGDKRLGRLDVNSFYLIQSHLKSGGAEYEIMREFRFKLVK